MAWSVHKSLFLRQEMGVWPAAAEAQQTIAALQTELDASRGKAAKAREEAKRATLVEQSVLMKYEDEVRAHRQTDEGRIEADKEAQSVRKARDLAVQKADQEKTLRHRAEGKRDLAVMQLERERVSFQEERDDAIAQLE